MSKLNNITLFNIYNYEAAGDGVTDDGPALQAMLNEMAVISGQVIALFPYGRFRITTPVSYSTPAALMTILRGENAVIIPNTAAGAGTKSIDILQANDVIIDGLIFDGNSISGNNTQSVFLNFYQCNAQIRNCIFKNIKTPSSVVKTIDSTLLIDNCHFIACTTTVADGNAYVLAVQAVSPGVRAVIVRDSVFDDVPRLSTGFTGSYIYITDVRYPIYEDNDQNTFEISNCRFNDAPRYGHIKFVPTTSRYERIWIHDCNFNVHDGVGEAVIDILQANHVRLERLWSGFSGVDVNRSAYKFTDAGSVRVEHCKLGGDSYYQPPIQGSIYITADALTRSLNIIDSDYTSLIVSCPTIVEKDGVTGRVRTGASVALNMLAKPDASNAGRAVQAGTSDTAMKILGPALQATAKPTGTVAFNASFNITEGDGMLVRDGINSVAIAQNIRFTLSGQSYPGAIVVDVTNSMTATERRDALITAITAAHGAGFQITASALNSTTVLLTNDNEGLAGNLWIPWISVTPGNVSTIVGAIVAYGMSGGNVAIAVIEERGQEVTLVSDGASAIAPGDVLSPSGSSAGRVTKSEADPYALAVGSAAASANVTVRAVIL